MADAKISALTGATTPLAGTEEVPVVQGGATRKVSIANLTTGRALSATELTLTTGNLIVSNGKGIDFSADPSAPGMTSELLDDYEEGTFTPAWTGSGGDPTVTYTAQTGQYTKVGNVVYFNLSLISSAQSGGSGNLGVSGLPFTAARQGTTAATFVFNFLSSALAPKQANVSGNTLLCYTNSTDNTNTLVTALTGSGGSVFFIVGGFYYV
jgi:hypothetical protein